MAASSSKKESSRGPAKKARPPAARDGARPARRAAVKPIRVDYLVEKLEEAHGDASTYPDLTENLDALVFAHIAQQMPLAEAKKAFFGLKAQFVDWNEVRISTAGEVKEVLRSAAEPLELAIFIKDFLQRLFQDQHHVGLEFLRTRTNPEIKNFFKKHPGFSESTMGLVLERVNDYPVIPLETYVQPFLERVGLGAPGTTALARQKELYEKIPRERVLTVSLLLHEHARGTCPPTEADLDCPGCALKRGCPYPAKVTPRRQASARRNAGK